MSDEQFAFVVGFAVGAIIGGLIVGRIMAVAYARIVAETPELRKRWLGK